MKMLTNAKKKNSNSGNVNILENDNKQHMIVLKNVLNNAYFITRRNV